MVVAIFGFTLSFTSSFIEMMRVDWSVGITEKMAIHSMTCFIMMFEFVGLFLSYSRLKLTLGYYSNYCVGFAT